MTSRPPHLTQERADRFKDQSVVEAYPLRWPYPPETFQVLVDLMVKPPGIVLDAGTGIGDIARPLVAHVGRVDAVDVSAPMLAQGRALPGGDHPGLCWIESRAEDVASGSRYSLVTAGESLHWMDWPIVLPRFRELLVPGGMLAIVQRSEGPVPWHDGLAELITTHSTVRNWEPFDLVAELEAQSLFKVRGRHRTTPVPSGNRLPTMSSRSIPVPASPARPCRRAPPMPSTTGCASLSGRGVKTVLSCFRRWAIWFGACRWRDDPA